MRRHCESNPRETQLKILQLCTGTQPHGVWEVTFLGFLGNTTGRSCIYHSWYHYHYYRHSKRPNSPRLAPLPTLISQALSYSTPRYHSEFKNVQGCSHGQRAEAYTMLRCSAKSPSVPLYLCHCDWDACVAHTGPTDNGRREVTNEPTAPKASLRRKCSSGWFPSRCLEKPTSFTGFVE